MNTKKTAPKPGAGLTIVTKEENTPTQPIQEANQDNTKETEVLKAEIKMLREKLAQSPENFEERIKYYQRKQELIERLQSLDSTYEVIETHIGDVSKEAEEDLFVSDNYKLTLSVKKGYNSESEVLKFRNPVIIADLLTFVLDKVGRKREQIQSEIQQ